MAGTLERVIPPRGWKTGHAKIRDERERERQWRIHQRGEGNQVTSLVLRFDFVKIASANGRS